MPIDFSKLPSTGIWTLLRHVCLIASPVHIAYSQHPRRSCLSRALARNRGEQDAARSRQQGACKATQTPYQVCSFFLNFHRFLPISSMFGTNGVATRSKARTLLGSRRSSFAPSPHHPIPSPCRLLTTSSQQGGRRHSQGRISEESKARQSRTSRHYWQSRSGRKRSAGVF
jgi:hypothetical protein